ncbi:MAG: SAM-dependent methyltransferase [Thermodesulfobacteriota bacterium]|nr:SAM-dependent methyltransferase [Thermodesulfobacteriota bacterium]
MLREIILEEIKRSGKITFSRFMELSLYHHEYGYYNTYREKIGKSGDYYTSPALHPIFGKLICNKIYHLWEELEKPCEFSIAEMGAGKGFLCYDILTHMEEKYPDLFSEVCYCISEVSRASLSYQKDYLASYMKTGKVIYQEPHMRSEKGHPFTGCFLSNELVDSFPVHVVRMESERLREIYVTQENGSFREVAGELSTQEIEHYLSDYGITLLESQRAEVNLSARHWLKGIATSLVKGFIITIDYGCIAEDLYSPYRMDGTLTCYSRHTVLYNPYVNIGTQDITAHINFSDLIEYGKKLGLEVVLFMPQYKFLMEAGLLEVLESMGRDTRGIHAKKELLAAKNFLLSGGMGSTFKVLVQKKNETTH